MMSHWPPPKSLTAEDHAIFRDLCERGGLHEPDRCALLFYQRADRRDFQIIFGLGSVAAHYKDGRCQAHDVMKEGIESLGWDAGQVFEQATSQMQLLKTLPAASENVS